MKCRLIALGASIGLLCSASAQDWSKVNFDRLPDEATKALVSGTEFTLYSLDPGSVQDLLANRSTPAPLGSLNGVKILGSLRLTDQNNALTAALSAVNDSIRAADRRRIGMCFFPRHALRVIANGKTWDFMICYQCQQIRLYEQGTVRAVIGIHNQPETLSNLLSAAKIPVAKVEPAK